jgi:uncharacterized protein (DUF58 family)
MRWFASSSSARGSEAAAPRGAGEALLSPALLDALSGLDLVSAARRRRPSEGIHPAQRHGREEEFFQHRPYVRGDDLRAVDWRASARTGHPLLKERHQPSRRPLTLLVDATASMGYPDDHAKLRQAKVLAAALAFLALRRGDSVQIARLHGAGFTRVARLRPAPRALHAISGALAPIAAEGEGDVGAALARIGPSLVKHGLVVVLSDLYGDEGPLLRAIASVRRVSELAVVQVLSTSEVSIGGARGATEGAPSTSPRGLAGSLSLRELEGGAVLSVGVEAARAHAGRVAAWRARLGTGVRRAGAEWVDAGAEEAAAAVLTRWLRRAA